MAFKNKEDQIAWSRARYLRHREAILVEKKERRISDPEFAAKLKTQDRAYYDKNKKAICVLQAQRYADKPGFSLGAKARAKKYYLANKEQSLRKSAENKRANAPRERARRRAWNKAHPEYCLAARAFRRALEALATPPWVDRAALQEKYAIAAQATARTGLKHVVDHFYPIKHRLLSGLHVPWNLRVIINHANSMKHNKVNPQMLHRVFS